MSNLNNEINFLRPFTKFCCSIGNLPSSYMTSLSYEEQLLWFCDYLENTVIPTINNNEEAVQELQNLYIELKSYVDNYFENLDIQEKINNKLDIMSKNGELTRLLLPYLSEQDYKINEIEKKVDSATNGSPIPVSSISEMKDTNKIYVNITNGHKYFYNGNNWIDFGPYQSIELGNNLINKYNLNDELKNALYKNYGNELPFDKSNIVQLMKQFDGDNFIGSLQVYSLVLKIIPSNKYIVKKMISNRFALYLSSDSPANNVLINSYIQNNSASELEITASENDNYLTILYYHTSDVKSQNEILNSIQVYKNEKIEPKTQTQYLEELINQVSNPIFNNKNIKLFNYRELGKLTKPYIAFSCDDGAHELATTTIPLLKELKNKYNKNIKTTFAIMDNSQIFNVENEINSIKDMLNFYDCSIAIHGTTSYTELSINELINFLDYQKSELTNLLGFSPTSIVFPNHSFNDITKTICASYFGVNCSGGIEKLIKYKHCNGYRSNIFSLYRFSLFGTTITKEIIKDIIDYCLENNFIFMPFWHDITLKNDYARCKDLLDYTVNYAIQKGIEFINIGDIPYLI